MVYLQYSNKREALTTVNAIYTIYTGNICRQFLRENGR